MEMRDWYMPWVYGDPGLRYKNYGIPVPMRYTITIWQWKHGLGNVRHFPG